MATLTLDMVVNETEPATGKAAIEEFTDELRTKGWTETEVAEIEFEVVTDHGPGGGWPVVRLTTDNERALYDAVLVYTGGDTDEADWLVHGE